jgi:hypothetical protein
LTWNIHDTQKHRTPTSGSPPPSNPPLPGPTPGQVALPTVLAGRTWEEERDLAPPRLTLDEERAALAMGLIPDRHWQAWAMLCRRGVTEI